MINVNNISIAWLWLCSKCHTIILLLLFLQHAVCMLRIVCKFSVCMKYPDDLLFLPESAKYNSSILKSVQKLCSEWHTIIQLLLYCSMLCEYCEQYVNFLYAWNARITCYICWNLMYASEDTAWDTVSQNATRSMWRFIFKGMSELEAGNSNYKCYTCICTYIHIHVNYKLSRCI